MLHCPADLVVVPVLAEYHSACFNPAWTQADFKALLQLSTTVVWMNTGCFLMCSVVLDEMEILTIGVVPENRKKGYAHGLIQEMLSYATSHAVRRVFLEVAVDNTPALALYKQAGFKENGRRHGYYTRPQGPVDALCLVWTSI